MPDYRGFMEDYIRRSYTIGGSIILPKKEKGSDGKRLPSLNQRRGTLRDINDRWDLTLECIRRYYIGESSPLSDVMEGDAWFFDKFIDFRGYVDFFFLQDCVLDDYSGVRLWYGEPGQEFKIDDLPKTVDEYMGWIKSQLFFVDRRNERIRRFLIHE